MKKSESINLLSFNKFCSTYAMYVMQNIECVFMLCLGMAKGIYVYAFISSYTSVGYPGMCIGRGQCLILESLVRVVREGSGEEVALPR